MTKKKTNQTQQDKPMASDAAPPSAQDKPIPCAATVHPPAAQTEAASSTPAKPSFDILPDQFDLAALFQLSQGDVLQMENSPLMPTLSSEPLEAMVLSVDQQTVSLRFSYYGVHLTTRTCKKTLDGFTWN